MDSTEVSQYDATGTTLQSHKKSTYQYDDSGIRVAQTELDDVNNDGDFEDVGTDTSQHTDYLVDHRNHTGYAQVLEEMLDPDGDGNAASQLAKSYTIGHDVFLEIVAGNQLRHLLKDGHGSTRQLVDGFGNVIQNGQTPQIFAYDAYGNPHGFTLAQALTTHLYSGEQTDHLTGLQYLRARYYNPATGTFNRLDPFAGNYSDPQSLHKYLYCHANPVNAVDPSGRLLLPLAVSLMRHAPTLQAYATAIDYSMLFGGVSSFLKRVAIDAATNEGPFWGKMFDAVVFSLTGTAMGRFSQLYNLGPFGSSGLGFQGSIDVLWFPERPQKLHVYRALGFATGTSGFSGSIEAGLVWDCPTPEAYTRYFMTVNGGWMEPGFLQGGGFMFDGMYRLLSTGGRGLSVSAFFDPTDFTEGAYGVSVGGAFSTGDSAQNYSTGDWSGGITHSTSWTYFKYWKTIPVTEKILEGMRWLINNRQNIWENLESGVDYVLDALLPD